MSYQRPVAGHLPSSVLAGAELMAQKLITPRRDNTFSPTFYSLQKKSHGAIKQAVEKAVSVSLKDFSLVGKEGQEGKEVFFGCTSRS